MNRALTCIGDYAKSPFYVDKVFVNVYSAEELWYVLYENAFLLERDILDMRLAEWIDRELGLKDLARDLYVLINQNASAASFVGTILSYVGYYSGEEISKAESILRMNVSMSVFEKWKAKADFLVENKHYTLAIHEYERLIKSLPDDEATLKANVYNNMGITYMYLYLFDSAEECFTMSYKTDNNEDAYRHYLTVKRMSLSDEDYIKLIAEEEESYRLSITLESRMDDVKRTFDRTDTARSLKELFELKNTKEGNLYYEEIARITHQLKEDYRDIVLENEQGTNTEN